MTQPELMELLNSLIAQWENEVVEFKAAGKGYSTGEIGEYFSALSNEANLRDCKNAWLVFGVDNKTRTVIGTDYPCNSKHLNNIKAWIRDGTVPNVSLIDIHILNH